MRDALEERLATRLRALGDTVADELAAAGRPRAAGAAPAPADARDAALVGRCAVAAAIVVAVGDGRGRARHVGSRRRSASRRRRRPIVGCAGARLAAAGHGDAVGARPLRASRSTRPGTRTRRWSTAEARRHHVRAGDRRPPCDLVPVVEERAARVRRCRARRHRRALVEDRDAGGRVRREPRRHAARALRRGRSRRRSLRAGEGRRRRADRGGRSRDASRRSTLSIGERDEPAVVARRLVPRGRELSRATACAAVGRIDVPAELGAPLASTRLATACPAPNRPCSRRRSSSGPAGCTC